MFPFLQRQAKYSENKLKCTKARNDYLLNLAATNAAISKYYIHDVSDLIDVSSWGVCADDLPGESHQLWEFPFSSPVTEPIPAMISH